MRKRMTHIIKILDSYADAIIDGRKNFEVRLNDRGYNAGDYVVFKVIYKDGCLFGNHPLNNKRYRITYVHSDLGLEKDYVVFGIKEQSKCPDREKEILKAIQTMGLFRTNYPNDEVERVVMKYIKAYIHGECIEKE